MIDEIKLERKAHYNRLLPVQQILKGTFISNVNYQVNSKLKRKQFYGKCLFLLLQ